MSIARRYKGKGKMVPGPCTARKVESSSSRNHLATVLCLQDGRDDFLPIPTRITAIMFKPRLRIPQAGLLRSSSSSTSHPSPLLAAAIAKPQQHQQQRSIHASSPVRHWKTTHDVPSLNPEIVAKGVPELYTQNGFNAAYTSYMEHCLENLKRLTDGMSNRLLRP